MRLRRVVIVGGGIGGMALAAALHKLRIDAHVYERAPELKEVGAGIALWPNARASLAQLGAAERALRGCAPLYKMEGMNHRGRILSAVDLRAEWPGAVEAFFHIVHRADLLTALTGQVPADCIHTGHACSGIELTTGGARAHFENGRSAEGDVLVGADGIHSIVRRILFGADALRYSGQTCARGLARVKLRQADTLREIQGPGQRCAVCPIADDHIYFWAAWNSPAAAPLPQSERRERLLAMYRGWPAEITDVIAATPGESILQNDLCDRRPIERWSRGAATLLGDAAHPTTPNLGQGANMAIDDALSLARCLRDAESVAAALARYELERRQRTAMIVRRSWYFGRLCRLQSPAAVWLREAMIRHTPAALLRAELRRQIFEKLEPLHH